MKLEIKNLTKTYKNKETPALDNISITLENGVYGLLGPNGAGKSTLMNILTENIKADNGEISIDGKSISELGDSFREILGYAPQQQGLYGEYTGEKFLYYMAALKGLKKKEAKAKINEVLELVNLKEAASKKIKGYSGGMKQRILIAQALLNNPKILILDEPTAGLDPKERIRIRNFISKMSVDKVIIIATHIVSDIESIAKEIILIKNGNIIDKKEPEKLIRALKGKVFEITCKKEELINIQNEFKVSNIFSGEEGLIARIISDKPPLKYKYEVVKPTLEDIYLYYFD